MSRFLTLLMDMNQGQAEPDWQKLTLMLLRNELTTNYYLLTMKANWVVIQVIEDRVNEVGHAIESGSH